MIMKMNHFLLQERAYLLATGLPVVLCNLELWVQTDIDKLRSISANCPPPGRAPGTPLFSFPSGNENADKSGFSIKKLKP